MNTEKSNKIKSTLKATKERRKEQICKVIELKVDKSRMSKKTSGQSKRVFIEAKWIYNYILAQEDVFKVSDKFNEIPVKVKDEFETRKIEVLGSQMKQGVLSGLHQNIYNLSKKKKKGQSVGSLNFISHYDSIDLKQHGITYTIKKNSVKVQGIKQKFRVRGADQLKGFEIANAKFIQKGGDYYFHVTCYKDKKIFEHEQQEKEIKNNKTPELKKIDIGFDYGIDHQLTLGDGGDDGIFIDYQINFPKRLKKLCRRLSKMKLHSSNWYKQQTKIRAEYEYLTNCKEDVKNKLTHILNTEFNNVFYQNDNFRGWMRIWGKRMLSTGIGGITARLKKSATSHQVDRFFPSTQKCSRCPNKQEMLLDERIFKCTCCGHTAPRDKNSADNILFEGQNKIGVEYAKFTPVKMKPLLSILEKLNAIPRVKASSVVDAGSPAYS